jgi:predicted Fe-S protein YdhL (DUF1289 family)
MTEPDAPVPSPCTSVCRMNADSGLCEGCLRTIDEIVAWAHLEAHEKREVWRLLDERRKHTASTKKAPAR